MTDGKFGLTELAPIGVTDGKFGLTELPPIGDPNGKFGLTELPPIGDPDGKFGLTELAPIGKTLLKIEFSSFRALLLLSFFTLQCLFPADFLIHNVLEAAEFNSEVALSFKVQILVFVSKLNPIHLEPALKQVALQSVKFVLFISLSKVCPVTE